MVLSFSIFYFLFIFSNNPGEYFFYFMYEKKNEFLIKIEFFELNTLYTVHSNSPGCYTKINTGNTVIVVVANAHCNCK